MRESIILNTKKETDSVVIFVHIRKTGGTTLQSIINEEFKNRNDLQMWEEGSPILWSPNLPIEQKKRIEMVRGHIIFGVHEYLPQSQFIYMTILRNPIERIISDYYYIKRDTKLGEFHKQFNKISLYEFVNSEHFDFKGFPNIANINLQTRILAGKNEDDLELAKQNLQKYFSVVGITERFDETLYLIKKKLDWKIARYTKRNVTLNRPSVEEIPNEIVDIIKNKNKKDMELYRFANELFNRQLKELQY